MLKGQKIPCIVTGKLSYFSKDALTKKTSKFGSVEDFAQHYVCPPARKLLRSGQTVEQIREGMGIEDLPEVKLEILSRLKLLKKPKTRRSAADVEQRQKYLNSREFREKMSAIKDRYENMSDAETIEYMTGGPGGCQREYGGTCVRPDIFLSWNNRACDGCPFHEHCLCDNKRLSHEKKPRRK